MRVKMLRYHEIVVAHSEQRTQLKMLFVRQQYDEQTGWMEKACDYVHQDIFVPSLAQPNTL